MKIFHDIVYNLNSFELRWNLVQFKFSWVSIELNRIQFQLKKNGMQIGAKGIENILITSICDYAVEKKVGLKKHRSAKYLSILFRVDSRLKYILVG